MKHIYVIFSICAFFSANGQKRIENVFQKQSANSVSSSRVKSSLGSIKSGQVLSMTKTKGAEIFKTEGAFSLQVPLKSGFVEVELEVATIFSPNFKVMTPSGEATDIELPHYYHGKIKGDPKSFVALTITKEAIEGMIVNDKLNLTIGRVRGIKESLHVIYNTRELPNRTPICGDAVRVEYEGKLPELQPNQTSAAGCKAVEIYLEADYQMYSDWGGSVQTVVNTMTSIFNNVSLLYDNEGINLVISTLFVWDSVDPYTSANDTSESLDLLGSYWNDLGNTFDGDIVHLVTTKPLGGGIAYYLYGSSVFNGMTSRAVFASCGKNYAKGLSANITNSVKNFPIYSWNVMVIAHEIGHNFGLPHTHSCTWSNGTTTGAIDNCATTEGDCAGGATPITGGTIMSYCHQGEGTNFANGFGPLPSGKMNAEFNAATCLSGSKIPRPIVENKIICSSGSVVLTATGCAGTYEWFDAPTSGNSISSTDSYTTPNLTTTTNYYVNCTESDCVGRRKEVTVTVFDTDPPAVQDVTVCGSSASAQLIADCNGVSVRWYDASTEGNLVGTGNGFSLNVTADTTVYAECSLTDCGVSTRAPLSITYQDACPYCEPTGLDCSDDDFIAQVKIDKGATNLYTSNTAIPCSTGGYSLSTPATEVALQKGQTYQITTLNPGIWEDGLVIWIDYNRNNVFEASERVESYSPTIWTQRLSSVTILATATEGLTRMRFKVSYNMISNDPCSSEDGIGYGEIEDYVVKITSDETTPCPPFLTHAAVVLPLGNYNAEQTIISQANVSTPTKFQAGNSIVLNAGFQAGPSEVFEAIIAGCPE
ncbi:MAG: hypothetical protein ACI9V1_003396 [Spirosomataceae bacterium]|jgi:hypothetical protein